MAYISREYHNILKKNKLIEHGDWIKLHRMSKEAGLKDGNGITAMTFRNAVVNGYTTTDEVVQLINALYEPKIEAWQKQKTTVRVMKEKLASI
jgi:hypothetical protein